MLCSCNIKLNYAGAFYIQYVSGKNMSTAIRGLFHQHSVMYGQGLAQISNVNLMNPDFIYILVLMCNQQSTTR